MTATSTCAIVCRHWRLTVRANVISAGYLDAMGIGRLRGRDFDTRDDAAGVRVAIVSRKLAERRWLGTDPVGQSLLTGAGAVPVVGVVPDSVYVSSVERNAPPFFYLPLSQNYESGVTLHLRTDRDPLTLMAAVRQAVRAVDPQVMVSRPRTMRDEFAMSLTERRGCARRHAAAEEPAVRHRANGPGHVPRRDRSTARCRRSRVRAASASGDAG